MGIYHVHSSDVQNSYFKKKIYYNYDLYNRKPFFLEIFLNFSLSFILISIKINVSRLYKYPK
jgi:hypothetical protein